MEEYYYKPDNRKSWQKNMVLALLVLVFLYVSEFVLGIPYKLYLLSRNFLKSTRKSPAESHARIVTETGDNETMNAYNNPGNTLARN